MKKYFIPTALGLSLVLAACSSDNEQATAAQPQDVVKSAPSKSNTPPVDSNLSKGSKVMSKWYTGTLSYIELEGGFYGFVSDSGERFLPLDLPEQYRKNGSKLKLLGFHDKDIMTIQMWGKPFRVLEVELLSEGNNTHPTH